MVNDIKYIILQQKYRKMHEKEPNIFPSEWYYIKEYDLKKKILSDCISNNLLIQESGYYLEFRKKALN